MADGGRPMAAAAPSPPLMLRVHRCCRNYLGSIQLHVINKVLLAFEQYRHDCITHLILLILG